MKIPAGSAKFVGVMGSGMIGSSPFDQHAWSGSSRYFFTECARQGVLHRAFGVEVRPARRLPLMARNFSFDRNRWRRKFYLDTAYYEHLSAGIAGALRPDDRPYPLLQIGGIYDLKPRLTGDRRVFSYHDGNLAQAMKSPGFARGVSRRHIQHALDYERRVYGNVDAIFTMSRYLKDSFVNDFGVDERKVTAIGAGINLDDLPPARIGKDYDRKTLLFVGADFRRKGGMDLLHAFVKVRSVHPTARLCIIGPATLSIPSGLSGGVEHLGFLSKHDPDQRRVFQQALDDAVLFVLPSQYEPFGIAPLEAMAYQIPAVLTDAWAFPEMVEPGINGALVKAGDTSGLADTIIGLLDNPDRLNRMGQAGREMVARKYTWQAVVARLREAVKECSR